MATPTYFNAAYYLETYSDLVDFGITEATAFEHFELAGQFELRNPDGAYAGRLTDANFTTYVLDNADLMAAFGVEEGATSLTKAQQDMAVQHYWAVGYSENRPGKLIDAPVDGDVDPVDPDPVDPDLTDLEAALVDYQDAADDQAAVIKAAAEKLGVENSFEDIEAARVEAAEALAGGDAYTSTANGDDADEGFGLPTSFATASASVQQASLTATANSLKADVNLAKDGLTATQQARVIKFEQAKADFSAAVEKMDAANSEGVVLEAGIDGANTAAVSAVKYTEPAGEDNSANFKFSLKVSAAFKAGDVIVTIDKDGKLAFSADGAGGIEAVTGDDHAAAREDAIKVVKGLAGFNSVEGVLKAANSAANDIDTTAAKLQDAIDAIEKLTFEGEDVTVDLKDEDKAGAGSFDSKDLNGFKDGKSTVVIEDIVIGDKFGEAASELSDAQAKLSAFEKLAEDFNATLTAYNDANEAEDATAAARKVLTEDFDVNPIIVGEEDVLGTDEDDLFVYTKEANKVTVNYFNEEGGGEDLFFFGSQFTLVELAAGDVMGKGGLGSKDVLELFAKQVGDNVVLYAELDEVGGTALGFQNVNEITLTGVNLDELDFQGGFLGMKAAEDVVA